MFSTAKEKSDHSDYIDPASTSINGDSLAADSPLNALIPAAFGCTVPGLTRIATPPTYYSTGHTGLFAHHGISRPEAAKVILDAPESEGNCCPCIIF